MKGRSCLYGTVALEALVLGRMFFFPRELPAVTMAFKTLFFPGQAGMAVVGRNWYYRFQRKKIENERDG